MKTPLGTEVDLGAGHVVLDGFPALRGGLLPYQVASSSFQPFGHNSAGCHSPRTNYYFVVGMHIVTVR